MENTENVNKESLCSADEIMRAAKSAERAEKSAAEAKISAAQVEEIESRVLRVQEEIQKISESLGKLVSLTPRAEKAAEEAEKSETAAKLAMKVTEDLQADTISKIEDFTKKLEKADHDITLVQLDKIQIQKDKAEIESMHLDTKEKHTKVTEIAESLVNKEREASNSALMASNSASAAMLAASNASESLTKSLQIQELVEKKASETCKAANLVSCLVEKIQDIASQVSKDALEAKAAAAACKPKEEPKKPLTNCQIHNLNRDIRSLGGCRTNCQIGTPKNNLKDLTDHLNSLREKIAKPSDKPLNPGTGVPKPKVDTTDLPEESKDGVIEDLIGVIEVTTPPVQ